MTRYTFDRVTATGHAVIWCENCDKRTKRQRCFEETVNPFNRNADGTVKTRAEVQASVLARARAWRPLLCAKCENERQGGAS